MGFNRTLRRGIFVIFLIFSAASSLRAQTPLKSTAFVPGSWSLVLLPDTQIYSRFNPGLFTLQTHWIVKNKDKCNIRYVLGLGDITDMDTEQEWVHAKEAIAELDGQVPYALASGNHDYTPHGNSITGASGMNKFFPPSSFQKWPTFGGVMKRDVTHSYHLFSAGKKDWSLIVREKQGDIANAYHLFSAGKSDWIVIVLQWAPTDAAIRWANDVLAKYPQRKAILVTHAYLYSDNTRYDFAKKGSSQHWNPHTYPCPGGNDGEELWQKLVRKNNFVLTFNGHVLNGGLGFLASKNDRGAVVHQMLVNYQIARWAARAICGCSNSSPTGRRSTPSRTRRCTTNTWRTRAISSASSWTGDGGAPEALTVFLRLVPRGLAVERFGVAQRGPGEAVEGDGDEAAHRHGEAAGHVVEIGDVSHQLGHHGAAHDRHDDEGRGLFRLRSQAENPQGEDRREHDRHEEIAEENAGHGHPSQLEEDQQAGDDVQQRVQGDNLVCRESPQQTSARKPTDQETDEAEGGEVGGETVAEAKSRVVVSDHAGIGVRQEEAIQPRRVRHLWILE